MIPVLPAVIIGGVAYEVVQSRKTDVLPASTRPYQQAPNPGATVGMTLAGFGGSNTPAQGDTPYAPPSTPGLYFASQFPGNGAVGPSRQLVYATYTSPQNLDQEVKQKLDAIENGCKDSYDSMSAQAKAAAVNALNDKLGLSPPLKPDASWDQIALASERAAGSQGAQAACQAIPYAGDAIAYTGACGKLGALCAEYLGTQLNELVAKDYQKVKAWIGDKIVSPIEDAKNSVEDAVHDAYNSVAGWLDF